MMLATAHGFDLKRIAGNSSNLDGVAATRSPNKEERRWHMEVAETVKGRESASYRRPYWSQAELGQAAGGLEELCWLAVRHSIAGDVSYETEATLWSALMAQLLRLAARERWRRAVIGRAPRDESGNPIPGARGRVQFYFCELAQLVLDEDANKPLFASAPFLHALYMGVEDEVWRRVLAPRYHALQTRYAVWLAQGMAHVKRRIAGE